MLIIERIAVAADLTKTEADLFHDLNQLVDAINGYHLQRTQWLDDDYLEDQKYLPPAQYSKQKIVSLLIKRQAAQHQRVIAIASNKHSEEHTAFFKPFRDADTARLAALKSTIKHDKKDIHLLEKRRESIAIEYSSLKATAIKAEKKVQHLEKKLSRYKDDIELIYELKQADIRFTQISERLAQCEVEYVATDTEIALRAETHSANEKEAAELKEKLAKMDATTVELESAIQLYAGTLHLTAVELAVVANLVDKLALAIGVAKKTAENFPKTLSENSMLQLEQFGNCVAELRIEIVEHMVAFVEVNNEYRRDLLKSGTIDKHGERLTDAAKTTNLEPLDHPELKDFKFELAYTLPDYVDPVYYIKREINLITKPNQFPLGRTLLPDISYGDELPQALLRGNTTLGSRISVKRYFDWHIKQAESGATTNTLDRQIAATDVVDHNEVDQLMFLADYHSDRHTVISDIVNSTQIMIHDLYDELAKFRKVDFDNQCKHIAVHAPAPKVVAAARPIAPQQAAQNHAWDIVPSQRNTDIAQKKENYRNIFIYEISVLLGELTAEIIRCKKIAANTLPEFFKTGLRNKIQSKETKKVSLERLMQSRTFDELAKNAALLSTDPTVTECFISSRTQKLLSDITEKAKPGYESPRAVS